MKMIAFLLAENEIWRGTTNSCKQTINKKTNKRTNKWTNKQINKNKNKIVPYKMAWIISKEENCDGTVDVIKDADKNQREK